MHISKKIAKGIGIILKARRYLTMKYFSPCTVHLFIYTSTIVSMYGMKHMVRIFTI